MLKEKGTITIGGRELTVRAFTLDQLQEIMPLFYVLISEGTLDNGLLYANAKKIIASATGLPLEEVGQLPVDNPREIITAVNKIAVVCGLVEKQKEAANPDTGESQPQIH